MGPAAWKRRSQLRVLAVRETHAVRVYVCVCVCVCMTVFVKTSTPREHVKHQKRTGNVATSAFFLTCQGAMVDEDRHTRNQTPNKETHGDRQLDEFSLMWLEAHATPC